MAEEKDTNFKVTDRRKFNADGTPREQSTEPAANAPEQAQDGSQAVDNQAADNQAANGQAAPATDDAPGADAAQSNVVSFPGEIVKKKERADSPPAPEASAAPDPSRTEQNSAAAARSAQVKAAASAAEQAYNQIKPGGAGALPEASFLGLLDMLAGEAAMCMGMVKNPTGAEIPTDLDTARQVIDMLGMLQQKTSGNLTAEENDVLENILGYLRMQFVALSRNK